MLVGKQSRLPMALQKKIVKAKMKKKKNSVMIYG